MDHKEMFTNLIDIGALHYHAMLLLLMLLLLLYLLRRGLWLSLSLSLSRLLLLHEPTSAGHFLHSLIWRLASLDNELRLLLQIFSTKTNTQLNYTPIFQQFSFKHTMKTYLRRLQQLILIWILIRLLYRRMY